MFNVYAIKDSLSSSILIESLFVKENDKVAIRYFKTFLTSVPETLVKDLKLIKFNSFELSDFTVVEMED